MLIQLKEVTKGYSKSRSKAAIPDQCLQIQSGRNSSDRRNPPCIVNYLPNFVAWYSVESVHPSRIVPMFSVIFHPLSKDQKRSA